MIETHASPATWRFSVAPMMDWTDCAEKLKCHHNLSPVIVSHAGPNAVPLT
jgi:hypothetical protein